MEREFKIDREIAQEIRRLEELYQHYKGPGGGGVLPEKLGRGVRPASQNPYPIYDQNL